MSKYRSLLSYAVPLIVSLSICVTVVRQVRTVALSSNDNYKAFYSFSGDVEGYTSIRQEWRARVLSNFLAGRLANLIDTVYEPRDIDAAMFYLPSAWTVGWLIATFLLLVLAFRERSLFFILGIYAGISFAYTPEMGMTRLMPWDMPALFSFTCFVIMIEKGRGRWVALLVPLATLFKETALLLSLSFLFQGDVRIRRRLAWFAGSLVAGFALKGIADVITQNPSPLFTMTVGDAPGAIRILDNIHELFSTRMDHPILADAGLVLSILILPPVNARIRMLKTIGVAFVLGNLTFGMIAEYRIWFEIIPLSLYALFLYFPSGAPDRKRFPAQRET